MAQPRFDTFMINNAAIIDGQISNVVVTDQDGDPNFVIETNDTFIVRVDWGISGLLQPALGGQWNLNIYAEKIGPGTDVTLYSQVVPLNPATPNYTVTTPAITHPTDTSGAVLDGTYQLSVVLTHSNGPVRTHMAGFLEGPVVQFYTAP